MLNDQFASVFSKEDTTDQPDKGPPGSPTMPSVPISEYWSPYDNRTWQLIRMLSEILKRPALTLLFQASVYQGKMLTIWNDAIVTPPFKKDDKDTTQCFLLYYIMA